MATQSKFILVDELYVNGTFNYIYGQFKHMANYSKPR